MNHDRRSEITASVGAHRDLGPGYDEAVAEGLVERIGEEIDRRVDARLGGQLDGRLGGRPASPPAPAAAPPAPRHRAGGMASVIISLGSIGLGLGATAIVTVHGKNAASQVLMVLLIWVAIAVVNVAHTRRRG